DLLDRHLELAKLGRGRGGQTEQHERGGKPAKIGQHAHLSYCVCEQHNSRRYATSARISSSDRFPPHAGISTDLFTALPPPCIALSRSSSVRADISPVSVWSRGWTAMSRTLMPRPSPSRPWHCVQ